ncbi:MAG: hypothetical protein LBI90_06640, partial [Treponema sp.]|nr:hypothetical protein [Treponema sp.]
MNGIISRLCAEVPLPKMIKVRQLFDRGRIETADIPSAALREISLSELRDPVKPGMRIAITCGSRGVANIALIIRALADFVRARGAHP